MPPLPVFMILAIDNLQCILETVLTHPAIHNRDIGRRLTMGKPSYLPLLNAIAVNEKKGEHFPERLGGHHAG